MTCNTDGTPNYTSAKYLVQKDPATITLADGSTVSGTLIETDLSAGFVYVDGTSSMVFQKDLGTRGTGIVTGITRNTDGTPNYTSAKYLVQKDPATITLADDSNVTRLISRNGP